MDLNKLLLDLRSQKEKLDRVIASLEELQSGENGASVPGSRRRGRKAMGPAERHVVSERMKKYWAKRRKQQASLWRTWDRLAGVAPYRRLRPIGLSAQVPAPILRTEGLRGSLVCRIALYMWLFEFHTISSSIRRVPSCSVLRGQARDT